MGRRQLLGLAVIGAQRPLQWQSPRSLPAQARFARRADGSAPPPVAKPPEPPRSSSLRSSCRWLSAPSSGKATGASPLKLASLVVPMAQRPLQWQSHRSLPAQARFARRADGSAPPPVAKPAEPPRSSSLRSPDTVECIPSIQVTLRVYTHNPIETQPSVPFLSRVGFTLFPIESLASPTYTGNGSARFASARDIPGFLSPFRRRKSSPPSSPLGGGCGFRGRQGVGILLVGSVPPSAFSEGKRQAYALMCP